MGSQVHATLFISDGMEIQGAIGTVVTTHPTGTPPKEGNIPLFFTVKELRTSPPLEGWLKAGVVYTLLYDIYPEASG